MTLLADNARLILLEALRAEVGIEIKIESRGDIIQPALRAKQILYRFKSEDSDFANLQVRLSPKSPDTHIWIIKKDASRDAQDR